MDTEDTQSGEVASGEVVVDETVSPDGVSATYRFLTRNWINGGTTAHDDLFSAVLEVADGMERPERSEYAVRVVFHRPGAER